MTDKRKAILLRIPADLWESLNGWARDELRSENAQIEYVLRELIGSMDEGPPVQRGRGAPAVLPAVCLWAGMLVCVLRGFSRQLDLWRLLALHGLWDYPRTPVCDEAVYDRLARSGDAPMATLFVRITQALR